MGTIRLEDVPVRDFLESQDHQHDLIRELQLIQIGDEVDPMSAEVPRRVARLINTILVRYQSVRSTTREQALAALDRGEERVTLDVPVQPGMAEALREWLRLLEEADDLCRDGAILLLACRPEVRELRRWYVRELTRNLPDVSRT